MTASSFLPPAFVELEPFADWWEVANSEERASLRHRSKMADLRTFYDATLPRTDEMLDHLGEFTMEDFPMPEIRLYRLLLGLCEASMAIELFGSPELPDVDASIRILNTGGIAPNRPRAGSIVMERLLEGKTALVTGGGSGIGRAAALKMALNGASVSIVDVNAAAAEETCDLIRASGGRAVAIVADITEEGEVQAMIERTVAEFGFLDCAFNNAGVGKLGRSLEDYSARTFASVMNVNLTGTWLCMKYELLQMRAQPGRAMAIVNNASSLGLVGAAGAAPYAASKHGVIGLTRSAALDHATSGIRINAVCPGLVLTPMAGPVAPTMALEALIARQPIGRWAQPEEIADVVLWLCSEGSSIVTGAAVAADGGWTAG